MCTSSNAELPTSTGLKRSMWISQVTLAGLKLIVLDEADKLFETGKGFIEQVDAIFAACKGCTDLTRCLFSATLPEWVHSVADSVLQDPVSITVGTRNAANANVEQSLLFVGRVRPS
jgi:ATP-dependent RNA helicase DDX52/ROK1